MIRFPTAADAAEYINAKVEAFRRLFTTLLDLQHRAARVSAEARLRGDMETAEEARASVDRIAALIRLHDGVARQLDSLLSLVPGLGAIQVPIIYAGAVLAAATGIAVLLSRTDAEARIVQLLERGALTPGEAERILAETEGGSPLGELAQGLKWVTAGVVAWAALRAWEAR